MSNDILGQILGNVFGQARGGAGAGGGLGDLLGGALGGALGGRSGAGGGGLGDLLGGVLGQAGGTGRAGADSPFGRGGAAANDGGGLLGGGKGALLAMLLPLVMQWVQRNGGIGAVLDRARQQGHAQQAASWISTGDNQPLEAAAVGDIVGLDELSRLSQQLGVPQQEVASGFAEILPEMVNQLTPQGQLEGDADDVLGSGLSALGPLLEQLRRG